MDVAITALVLECGFSIKGAANGEDVTSLNIGKCLFEAVLVRNDKVGNIGIGSCTTRCFAGVLVLRIETEREVLDREEIRSVLVLSGASK